MGNDIPAGAQVPRDTIMVVDDTPENLVLLSRILQPEGYKVMVLPDGKRALEAIRARQPDLILLDIMMPGMDGFQVCAALKADPATATIPIIFISALSEPLDKVKAFDAGAVDYITKPFNVMEVKARVGVHLDLSFLQKELEYYNARLEERVREQVMELSRGHLALITAMSKLASVRDSETGDHIERTRRLCRLLAELLKKTPAFADAIDEGFVENIYNASPLHDIGKVAISDYVLLKEGELLPEEFEVMKTHTTIGKEYLGQALAKSPGNKYLRMGMEIAGNHHERWDGQGYPVGLSGEDIPLSARIMSLVDVYDALRSKRSYKEAFSHDAVVEIMRWEGGRRFDPDILAVFLDNDAEFERERDGPV
ncbi:MAG: two-component system response regulator [Candidatus Melainabacteria bacterium HGW-Melainabacteria-1]|nr:MAG: two-component system response regulator [Candidatus Melainabacteria bacterium HGW-Melainabacteria-1]